MGEIKELLLEIIKRRGKATINSLYKETRIHPGIIKVLVKELEKEGKIIRERKKNTHNSKKYEILYK